MGLITRFTRLCKADIHGMMDQIEDKDLVLKQCLREMEKAIDQKQVRLNELKASLERHHHETAQLKSEQEKLEEDLSAALSKERDDIARMVIKKLIALEHHVKAMGFNAGILEKEIVVLTENLEIQKLQYKEIELRSETYFHQRDCDHMKKGPSHSWPDSGWSSVSEAEIELELIKRKEFIKGGQ